MMVWAAQNIERQVSSKALKSSFAVFKLVSCCFPGSSASSRQELKDSTRSLDKVLRSETVGGHQGALGTMVS